MSLDQHKQHHLNKHPLHHRILYYALSLALLIILISLVESGFHSIIPRNFFSVFQRLSFARLLLYSFFTFARLAVAYIFALTLTFFILLALLASRKFESFVLPIFDILQSVPVLAFFPLIIVIFARLHVPELAAQVVLLVAMLWSVLFDAMGGIHQIPEDILEAAEIYGAKGNLKFERVIVPAIFPSLVTGSILSFGAGWNVIIISEYINYGTIQIHLPGLGSLLATSAGNDIGVFLITLVMLVIIISIVNRLVWHKLLIYSEKFKFE